jgi:hypothetical protein
MPMSMPALTPPRSRKHPEWTTTFLDALRDTLAVTKACEAAGISRAAAYKYRGKTRWFARAWDEALQHGIDQLEQSAWEMARNGDRAMLMFLLRSLRPTTYHMTPSRPLPPKPAPLPMIRFKKVPARPRDDNW